MQVTGIVLAGGRSTRFGSDKLAAEVDGEPLLHRAIHRLAEVTDQVVVVLAHGAEPPDAPDAVEVAFAFDEEPDQGPLQGTLAGLAAAPAGIAVVVGGDMPDLSPDVMRELMKLAEESGHAAVLEDTTAQRGFRPLPMAVSVARARPVVQSLLGTGTRSLHGFAAAMHPTVVPEKVWLKFDPDRGSLRDVDEPSDLGIG